MDSTENKPTGVPEETGGPHTSLDPVNDGTNTYNYYDDYGYDHPPREDSLAVVEQAKEPPATPPPAPPPPSPPPEKEDEDDDGMLRMSFLEHLEELRTRLLRSIVGVVVAFASCI